MTLQAALDGFDAWARVKFDGTGKGGETIDTIRESREIDWYDGGMQQGPAHLYGWEDFGDFPRATLNFNTSGLHFPYGLLLDYIRLRDPWFWEEAQIQVYHKIDMDVIHDPAGSGVGSHRYQTHGAQRYEANSHQDQSGGNRSGGTWGTSHAWISSLVLYYLMTGEERYREVAEDMAEHARRWLIDWKHCDSQSPCATRESRQQGRALYIVVNVYRLNGDESLWTFAQQLVNNAILSREANGNKGYLFFETNDAWMFYEAIVSEALVQFWYEATAKGDAVNADLVKNYLIRHANWMMGLPARSGNGPYTSYQNGDNGTYDANGNYLPFCVGTGGWNLGSQWAASSANFWYSYYHADVFAMLYEATGDQSYMDSARKIFRDALFYYYPNAGGGNYQPVRTSATPTNHFFNVWIKVFPIPGAAAPLAYLNIEYRLGAAVPCHTDCQ